MQTTIQQYSNSLYVGRGLRIRSQAAIERAARTERRELRRELIESKWNLRSLKNQLRSELYLRAMYQLDFLIAVAQGDVDAGSEAVLEAGAWSVQFAVTKAWVARGRN